MSVDVEGKSLTELLDMLVPAPAPEPISMVPQTWGWIVLLFVFVTAFAGSALVLHKHRQANAYRRSALTALANAGNDIAKIAEILKRTALTAYPREQVAGLYGQKWLNFLNQTSDKNIFSDAQAQSLIQAPYRRGIQDAGVSHAARDWIRSHKTGRRGR